MFYNAKHCGRISKPDAVGRVGENDEGLVIELTWRVVGGVIVDAKFRAFANPNAIAITSLMVDNLIGKTIEEALLINESVIIDNLDEFRPEYIEVYDVVRQCITEAYNSYSKKSNHKEQDYQEADISLYQTEEDEQKQELYVARQIQRELQGEEPKTMGKRGRPRKEIDPSQVVEEGEKRGRGRPRKEVDPNEVIEVGEKRGRGRPRKIVDESEIIEVGEKRGRGRPRKEVDPSLVVEAGEKRGRGRPKKVVDETEIVEVGEKRGRGRPKKEIKFTIPSDLDEVEYDEDMDELINGTSHTETTITEVSNQVLEQENKLIDEDDETFEADYDLFKSNIRNIFTGKEVSTKTYGNKAELIKTQVEESAVEPIKVEPAKVEHTKIVVEEDLQEKRGRGRPRKEDPIPNPHAKSSVNAVNSITRSLTPNAMPIRNSQDIMFASKNITTTNININVTKTTADVDQNNYSHNISTLQRKVEVSSIAKRDDEIDIEPVKVSPVNTFEDFDDDFDDIDTSKVKDEAPTGGLEDLLKALLDD